MPKNDKFLVREILADNIKKLSEGAKSLRAWAIEHKLHPVKVRRAAVGENGASVETVQEIAAGIGIEPWRLLAPGMRVPLPEASPKAAELARLYDACKDKRSQEVAYATARFWLTGQSPDDSALQTEESESHEPASAPSATPHLA